MQATGHELRECRRRFTPPHLEYCLKAGETGLSSSEASLNQARGQEIQELDKIKDEISRDASSSNHDSRADQLRSQSSSPSKPLLLSSTYWVQKSALVHQADHNVDTDHLMCRVSWQSNAHGDNHAEKCRSNHLPSFIATQLGQLSGTSRVTLGCSGIAACTAVQLDVQGRLGCLGGTPSELNECGLEESQWLSTPRTTGRTFHLATPS